jgi:hypothetical protein
MSNLNTYSFLQSEHSTELYFDVTSRFYLHLRFMTMARHRLFKPVTPKNISNFAMF